MWKVSRSLKHTFLTIWGNLFGDLTNLKRFCTCNCGVRGVKWKDDVWQKSSTPNSFVLCNNEETSYIIVSISGTSLLVLLSACENIIKASEDKLITEKNNSSREIWHLLITLCQENFEHTRISLRIVQSKYHTHVTKKFKQL